MLGFDMNAESLNRKGAMDGEKKGVRNVSFISGGGSQSTQREPPASHMLLRTFSLMDNPIG